MIKPGWYFVKMRQVKKAIKQDFKEFSYKGVDVLKNGNTELFTKDVLNLEVEI